MMGWLKTRWARTALLVACAAAPFGAPEPAAACGPDTDCVIGDRSYRIRMPEGHDGVAPVGVIVFAHGYRGSARGVMGNRRLAAVASELGVALIAGQAAYDDWALPNAPQQGARADIDEAAYFDAVLDDAAARFAIDLDRVMATGFSAGGMMVWTLICRRGARYAGFAPISGTFWRPAPERCEPPVASVIHIHGDDDPVVPLRGRPIAQTHQGDVFVALEMYARFGGFGPPTRFDNDDWRCERRINDAGRFLDFCLFPGGHSFRAAYVARAWRTFAARGAL